MPITKTAKRALRSSKRKKEVNDRIRTKLEIAIRLAKKEKSKKAISNAFSAADRAAKVNLIHKNKAARIKSQLSKLLIKKKSKSSRASKRNR
jgi:small subunit ribosomal protein S20